MKIRIVGLGFGDVHTLPYGVIEVLQSNQPIWLRTAKHPVVSWMQEKGIHFQTFDEVYQTSTDFEAVYEQIVEKLLSVAKWSTEVIYAVPGHPMVAERTVQMLLNQREQTGTTIEIVGGASFLDGLFSRLEIDPIEGFALLDGSDLMSQQINPHVHLLIGQVYSRMVASDVKLTLLEVYPPETPVTIATGIGIPQLEQVTEVLLHQLDHRELFTDFTSIYLSPVSDLLKTPRRFESLVYLFEHLRGPAGCPWDRKQTHKSLRPYLVEETYEFLEAVAKNDEEAMADELGDVLLQVILHAQIAKESEAFDIYEVIENLVEKMIRRHPHVFGEQQMDTAEEVKITWDEIKQQEKREDQPTSRMSRIPQGLPALPTAYRMQKIAAKVGFDWDDKKSVAAKMTEEMLELFQAQTAEEKSEELGDLLFTVVNLARFFDTEPETALLQACYKFKQRFQFLEQKANESGESMESCAMTRLDQWWNEAKESSD